MKRGIISVFVSACLGLTTVFSAPAIYAAEADSELSIEKSEKIDESEDEIENDEIKEEDTDDNEDKDYIDDKSDKEEADEGEDDEDNEDDNADSDSDTDTDTDEPSVYEKQEGSGKCTLASAVMMLRQKSVNEGNETWPNITQRGLSRTAWLSGVGMLHSYTFYGMSVSYKKLESEDKKEELIELLEEHPEGLEIYNRTLPHAVFLTRYDEDKDIFYCADPALSAVEMELEDSWLRKVSSGADQDDIIDKLDSYWYISSYKYMEIPEYGSNPSDDPDDSKDFDKINDGDQFGDDEPGNDYEILGGEEGNKDGDSDNKANAEPKFSRVSSYSAGLFSDVVEDEWYIDYIKTVYEMGIMKGTDNKKFGVKNNLTVAQAITMAARVYSAYKGDKYDFVQSDGGDWYMTYVDYALKNSIITSKYGSGTDYNAFATRSQFAEIIGGAVPEDEIEDINTVEDGDIPDVEESDEAGKAIYRFYRAGILTGDSSGEFMPESNITRAQVAAIMARIADEGLRVEF